MTNNKHGNRWIGAVLPQAEIQGKYHPMLVISRKLTVHEAILVRDVLVLLGRFRESRLVEKMSYED